MAKLKSDAEKARAKENYKRLREAGFSAKEATRYRYSAQENVERAILNKYLPAPKASKQGALKPKVIDTKYSSMAMRSIELQNVGRIQLKKAFKLMQQYYTEGYTYFNIVVTYSWSNGEEQSYTYNPEKKTGKGIIEQGAMIPAIEWIKKKLKDAVFDLETEIANAMKQVTGKYEPTLVFMDEDLTPEITITINMWKASA